METKKNCLEVEEEKKRRKKMKERRQKIDSAGLVCTCPHESPRPPSPATVSPSLPQGREDGGRDLPRPRHRHTYRRSVSLGQILQRSDSSSSDVSGLYHPGGSFQRDAGGSPRPNRHAHAHAHAQPPSESAEGQELSDFEKENLLFVRELDNSYHRPLCHSLSNTSLGSTFSEDSLTGESTSRGGSPYPGRREYPRGVFSPPRVPPSSLLRSVSREEDEEEEEEEEEGEAYTIPRRGGGGGGGGGGRLVNGGLTTSTTTTTSAILPSSSSYSSFLSSSSPPPPPPSVFRRKVSIPALSGNISDSSVPSTVSGHQGAAWWSHTAPHPPMAPPAPQDPPKPTANHSAPFPDVTKPSANRIISLSDVLKSPNQRSGFPYGAQSLPNHEPAFSGVANLSPNHKREFGYPGKPSSNHKPAQCDVRMLLANRSLSSPANRTNQCGSSPPPPTPLPPPPGVTSSSSASSSSWLTTFKELAERGECDGRLDSEPREKNNLSSTATTTSTTTPTTTSTTTTTPTTTSTTTSRSAPPKTTTTTGPTNDAKKVNNSTKTSTEKLKKGIESELEVTESEERRRGGGGGGGGGGGSSLEKEDPGTESEPKKHYPMAFTVDIGDGSGNSEAAATKKLDIAASISKWAPKHRRNLSLTKVDEHKVVENFFDENGNSRNRRRSTISRLDKVEERSAKPPLGRPRSGTVGAAAGLAGRRGGYHSEGYFSSDQDDDNPRRTELKSPRSPRTPELRSPQTPQRLVRSSSQDSAKGGSLRMHSTPSPDTPRGAPAAPHSLPALTLHESASFLLEKMMTTAPESLRKHQGSRSEGRPCCRTEGKKPTLAEATGRSGKNKAMDRMNAECRKQSSSVTSLSSSHTFEMKQDPAKEEKDDVSEAGTYTIEKDSSSPEVEQARSDIDRVFGISGTESEVEGGGLGSNQLTPRGPPPPPDDPWASPAGADQDKFKKPGQREMSPGSLSRNSPNWIQQWAAQVAEHTKTTSELSKPPQSSPRGTRGAANTTASPSPLNPLNTHSISLSSSQESSEARPRRKLPTPPTAPLKGGGGGGGGDGLSDGECPPGKGRHHLHHPILDTSTDERDSSRDFLRHTERLVTSLQARVGAAQTGVALRGSSFESHDSGGDSDIDTSTSYPTQEDERLSHIGTQLKARLRLVGIDGGSIGARTPPQAPSPRRPLGTSGSDTQEVVRKGFRRERSNVSDGAYDGYLGRDDGTASDSSSDGSDGLGAGGSVGAGVAKKNVENNPPLKFNRAFSLRRARLGCDDTQTQPVKPPSPIDKKKATIRPSSAGSLTGVRKLPLGHSKSQVGVGQRGVGISGAGHGQSSLPAAPRSTNANADFSRGDGGRFSLRLPRSGSTSAVSKSPSRASSIQKEGSIGGGVGGGGRRRGVAAPRSNSTLSAKEVDFQNWKRRKNYDPMKAAAEGRKKVTDKRGVEKGGSGGGGGGGGGVDRSPSPPASLLRSASFHGTEGMGASGAGRWPRPRPHHLYPSEDEGPYSLEEEVRGQQPPPCPHCSPLRRSPTSPHQLCSPHTTSPAHQPNSLTSVARARRSSYAMSDDGEGQVTSPTRKTSLDESGSEGKRSPISSTRGLVSSRSKAKMEALDNLVISTIHSLSVKVRTTSETLLQKLKSQYDEEGDRAALLEEVLAHLSESDQLTGGGGGGRSTSRELAGILRNLKKIEHALEVIDRVMICVDDDDDDDDDEGRGGRGGGADWGESDY
ncbi:mucin-19-like [Eriocheir sinensis]|uniref:mucin-19-like n=1 Tax=Eriocheir sinensis TaxID=95602 RepID=UPI0021C76559|nr:mucin-19-like [Eriocheir sinensis]